MSDQREGEAQRRENDASKPRRPYVAPELVEYGTVSKLTQAGSGLYADFSGMMMAMICL